MAANNWWAEAEQQVVAMTAPSPPTPPAPWWAEAEQQVVAMAAPPPPPPPTQALAFASGPGIEPTTALAAQLGVGVGAALVLLSPRWRRKIPPALLLIASAAIIAYIQTRARPASMTLTVTPPPQQLAAPTRQTGPVSGFYDSLGRFVYDQTGL